MGRVSHPDVLHYAVHHAPDVSPPHTATIGRGDQLPGGIKPSKPSPRPDAVANKRCRPCRQSASPRCLGVICLRGPSGVSISVEDAWQSDATTPSVLWFQIRKECELQSLRPLTTLSSHDARSQGDCLKVLMQLVCTLAFAGAVACSAHATATSNGPRRVVEVEASEVSYRSLDELWGDSVVVLRARVSSTVVRVEGTPEQPRAVLTEATLQVTHVYKGATAVAAHGPLVVHQVAGEHVARTRTIRVADREALQDGAEYVLFLGWNPHFKRWMVRGSHGVYEVRGGYIRAHAKSPMARQHDGRAISVLESDLRRIAATQASH